jgi:predicted phage terminase large subunit-like protein
VCRPELWLCTRQIQKSIKHSVHKLLADTIASLNVGYYFDVQATEIKRHDGGGFLFSGLQDHTVDSIKSYEGCDGAWVEEAHSVSKDAAEVLIPTIRKEGSEILWTYNPNLEEDYVHQRFVVKKDPNAVVVTVNWRDNPWFPSVLELERVQLKAINEDLYEHVWEGALRSLAGLLFKRKWFKRYDKLPDALNRYMSSDYAVSEEDEDNEPDYTSLGMWGIDPVGDLYATDWWSDQADPERWINAAVGMVKRTRPLMWFEEKGVILRAVDSALTKRLREKDIFVHREALASAGNKAERALGFAARASAGAVWFPQTPKDYDIAKEGEKFWADRVIDQLCSFTGQDGKRDDDVDVCSLIARGLDRMANARPVEKVEDKKIKPFTRAHFEAAENDERMEADERRRHYS